MKKSLLLLFIVTQILFSCKNNNNQNNNYTTIDGFSQSENQQLKLFFEKYKNSKERKIAVFDGDGTVMGQTL